MTSRIKLTFEHTLTIFSDEAKQQDFKRIKFPHKCSLTSSAFYDKAYAAFSTSTVNTLSKEIDFPQILLFRQVNKRACTLQMYIKLQALEQIWNIRAK